MSVHQKLGIILESKVIKIESIENFFSKKWSPRLIFLHEIYFWKKFEKFSGSLKIDFDSTILAFFNSLTD